ncbi:prolyl oligopeptidase family serine peptidase [Herbidospora daliensis]|uniref:prolyl oligopeptidase family serine peptidase n=1 Tax=Herbidospora daliensis TaxID=295585 RepID=UPI000A53A63C|nr:prolyl oligopeptidase family serine peptidase [Herbidospora daliensis]
MIVTGVAAGVPFAALSPAEPRPDSPVVVAWHLLDAPRTETAFAAAIPLRGLGHAWRFYLGLPLSGSRAPEGGLEALMGGDVVLDVHWPVVSGAASEFPAAWAELRERFGIGHDRVALMGGSAGAAAAQLVLAEGGFEVPAIVLLSPVTRLRAVIDGLSVHYGMTYDWSPPASEVASRLDFPARADDLGDTPMLIVVGEDDLPGAFLTPAEALVAMRTAPTELVVVAGMGHALADEPGVEPAPQTERAREVDALASAFFAAHLP